MVTLHSKTLLSSTKPAEKPSTGFLQRSESSYIHKNKTISSSINQTKWNNWSICVQVDESDWPTFQLLNKKKTCLGGWSHIPHTRRKRECGGFERRAADVRARGKRGWLLLGFCVFIVDEESEMRSTKGGRSTLLSLLVSFDSILMNCSHILFVTRLLIRLIKSNFALIKF